MMLLQKESVPFACHKVDIVIFVLPALLLVLNTLLKPHCAALIDAVQPMELGLARHGFFKCLFRLIFQSNQSAL